MYIYTTYVHDIYHINWFAGIFPSTVIVDIWNSTKQFNILAAQTVIATSWHTSIYSYPLDIKQ